jgi:ribokinase
MARPPGSGDIAVVGSANADLVVSVARLPRPGETIAAADLKTCAGGKGANQAAAAARCLLPGRGRDGELAQPQQQRRSRLVALFGDDASGAALRRALGESGVDLSLSRTLPDAPTGTALISVLPSGENTIVIAGGANQSDAGWEAVLGRPAEGDAGGPATAPPAAALLSAGGGGAAAAVCALLLQREIPDWANARAAALAARSGAAVVLDAGGADAPLSDALLASVAVLSPNETELARLAADGGAGPPPPRGELDEGASSGVLSDATRAWVERAARLLLARLEGAASAADKDTRPRAVLVKLGAAGSALFSGSPSSPSPPPSLWQPALAPEGPVVDTTGAGDCFTAAFAVARFAEGRGAREALLFASAAACLCVQRAGAQPSMPRRDEVEALLLRQQRSEGGAP